MSTPVAQSIDTLAGRTSTAPFITIIQARAPTSYDGINNALQVGQRWIDTSDDNKEYFLLNFISFAGVVTANWILLSAGSGTVETLTGNSGGPVGVDSSDNINIIGDGTTIEVVGTPLTNTLTISAISGVGILSIAGDTGSISGTAVTIYANNAGLNCGSSVYFHNIGTVSTMNVTDPNDNTIIGNAAGNLSLTGMYNTGLGYGVFANGTTLSSSVAVGFEALDASEADEGNTACGWSTLGNLNGGSFNTAIGLQSLIASTADSQNTGVGANSLTLLNGGDSNTSIGFATGSNLLTGDTNLFLGFNSGISYTSSESANVLINATGVIGESSVIRISDPISAATPATSCYIGGINNTNSSGFTAPLPVYVDSSNGQLGYGASSSLSTLSDDTATAVTPSAGNIQLIGHINEQFGTKFSTVVAGSHLLNINPMSGARWIVDPLGFNGTHTTIGSAMTSAYEGDTIWILPGTYTENFAITNGVNMVANYDVTIVGALTYAGASTATIANITLVTNNAFILTLSGPDDCVLNLVNCYINCTNSDGILISPSARINFYNCGGDVGTTGIAFFYSTSFLPINIFGCYFTNSGLTTQASGSDGGNVNIYWSQIDFPLFSSGNITGNQMYNSSFNTSAVNTPCVAFTVSSAPTISNCSFQSGTAACLTINGLVTVNLSNCTLGSTGSDVLTGTGTVNTGGNVCLVSSGNTVSTINHLTVI